jgi:hypothetical protein
LSFTLERIGPLAAIIIIVFYLLVLYLLALSNTPENPFASIYSESLSKTACQHLLLLVGFDTLIYRKYYDTPPILVGHHASQGGHGCPSGNFGDIDTNTTGGGKASCDGAAARDAHGDGAIADHGATASDRGAKGHGGGTANYKLISSCVTW